MGKHLSHGLGGRGHWLDMLGGGKGKVNDSGWHDEGILYLLS
jgi:hypothetical protein